MKPDERDDAAALMVLFVIVVIFIALVGAGAAFLAFGARSESVGM
jgi:hypothetical protein